MKRTLVVLALCGAAAASAAEEKRMLVSSAFGDPSIVAPGVRYDVERDDGTSYSTALTGWTFESEWTKPLGATRAVRFLTDATPLNAHNSNRMYVNGRRTRELDFDDASYRVRACMRFTPGPRSTTDVMLVALYESVSGLPPEIQQRWNSPYAGVEVAHTYSVINERSPLIGAFDGIEITGQGEFLIGEESWSRVMLVERAGHDAGRFHFRQSLAVMNGSALDVVNRFVVGGSWDVLGGTAVYGTRYGEMRVARAVIASGGADLRLRGNWRAGIRGSYIDSDHGSTYGHALNASTTWRTFGVNFGVGVPEKHVYAAVIVPLYRR